MTSKFLEFLYYFICLLCALCSLIISIVHYHAFFTVKMFDLFYPFVIKKINWIAAVLLLESLKSVWIYFFTFFVQARLNCFHMFLSSRTLQSIWNVKISMFVLCIYWIPRFVTMAHGHFYVSVVYLSAWSPGFSSCFWTQYTLSAISLWQMSPNL